MVDDAAFADLASTVHRVEAKVDVALTATQARVDEHGRILASVVKEQADQDLRLRKVEQTQAAQASQISTLVDVARRPATWPSIASAVVAIAALAVTVVLELAK